MRVDKFHALSFVILLAFLAAVSSATLAQEIAYGSGVAGSSDIWASDPEGGAGVNLSRVSHDPDGEFEESEPYWSADGTRIVFISDKDGCRNLWVMNADGTNDHNLTNSPFMELSPRWSPIEDKIFFTRSDSCSTNGCVVWPKFEIFSFELSTETATQITFNSFRDISPVVSPDGQSLAITRGENPNDCGNQTNLWKISADGMFENQLDPSGGTNNGYYEWSGDWFGGTIVFAKQMGCSVGFCNEIVEINSDGSGFTRITDNDYYDFPCGYSPDGANLLILSRRDGNYNFWTLNREDGTLTQLTSDGSPKSCGDWRSGPLMPQIDVVPAFVNPRSQGVIPVVIFTTQPDFDEALEFDATLVDPLSVRLGPGQATEAHGAGHYEDFDADGDLDLMLHFRIQETGVECGDTLLQLTGATTTGQTFEAADMIQTVGCRVSRQVESQFRHSTRQAIGVTGPATQAFSRDDF